jgi:hypothetical protein
LVIGNEECVLVGGMTTQQTIQALIVTGQLSAEHDPKTSQLLRRMLESTGAVTLAPPDLMGENRRRAWPYYCDLSLAEASALTP